MIDNEWDLAKAWRVVHVKMKGAGGEQDRHLSASERWFNQAV